MALTPETDAITQYSTDYKQNVQRLQQVSLEPVLLSADKSFWLICRAMQSAEVA